MKRLLILLILSSSLSIAAEKIPIYHDPDVGMYFKDWLLCGPFPNPLPAGIKEYKHNETSLGFYRDYFQSVGGESKILPYEGMKIKHPDGHHLIWQRYHGYFGLVPLDEIFTPNTQTIAYAYCVVRSSESRTVVLSVTSNDGVRVWHNGQLILDHNIGGTEEPDRDLLPIVLSKGDNHFLFKIAQGFGKWSFQFRLLDLAATVREMETRAYLFSRPEITETADEWQFFVGQKYKVELLPSKIPARLEITNLDGKDIVAAFDTFLGKSLVVKKSELTLLPGLHPVLCKVTKPDGMLHTLRTSIWVGDQPAIAEIYRSFQNIPRLDSTTFYGKQMNHIFNCLDFHLQQDAYEGICAPMDMWTQQKVVEQYREFVHAIKNAPSPYHLVFPPIQKIELKDDGVFNVALHNTFHDMTNGLCSADIERLTQTLQENKIDLKFSASNAAMTMGLAEDMAKEIEGIHLPNDEAYFITIQSQQLKIIGASPEALHHALTTLRQIFELTTMLPTATILDYPAHAHRCAFTYWPVPMNDAAKARLLEYIDLKYNEIVIASDRYQHLDDPTVRQGLEEYFKFVRSYQVEPIPTVWLNGDKSWYEGVWLQEEPIVFQNDKATFGFQRLIDLESSVPMIHSEIGGGIIYERNRDYQIMSIEPPVIRRMVDGKIPENRIVYLDADIVDQRTHRYFKPCASEEAAYQEFDAHIQKTIAYLQPAKIHVNHDELGILNSDSRCRQRNMKDFELVAYQINRMHDIIKKHSPQVDMIMWADAVNPYHNADKKQLENVCDRLHRDIMMAHWFYTAENFEQVDLVELGAKFFLDKGFRMYGCPWDHLVNHQVWEKVMSRYDDNPACLGLMHTQWSGRNSGHAQTAAINWTGKTWAR